MNQCRAAGEGISPGVETARFPSQPTLRYAAAVSATLDSVCPLDCPDTCSLSVRVDGGRITKVDGSRRNPFTGGFICAKVRRYPERIYSPLRIQYPQKRAGAKGAGRFARISWDEALATIAERFRGIIAAEGAEAILPYHYGGSSGVFGEGAADARFFNRLGASELLKTICAAPTGTAYRAMYGTMGGVPPQDYPLARAIILWGVNPSATSIHLVPEIHAARRAGAFVAVIDPRRTTLARSATLHLQPLPGTDVVLALAMINELIRTGRTDDGFLRAHANGFDALARAAAEYSLPRAASICQIGEADIAALVEAYAAASPAVIRCGWGVERNRNGGHAAHAIFALPAVAGKFGVRGGGLTMSLSRAFPLNGEALARPDLRRGTVRQLNMTQLGRVLTAPQTPPVRALFVYNANPVAMAPNQNLVLRGLAREDLFTVVHEQVLTDTARFADIVLPATTVFEQRELHKSYGHYALQYSEAVIAPVGEACSNPELFARLSQAMGFDEPALRAGADELLRDALDGGRQRLGGVTVDDLRERKLAQVHFSGQTELIQFVTDFPMTRSGKVELSPALLGPPRFMPAPAAPYPLVLLSPASDKMINSIFGEFNLPHAQLQMHPDDAAARGIGDGDIVRVYNELGEVHVPARVGDDCRHGIVALPKGLWCASTLNGATAVALAPDHLSDIGAGACFNDALVEVARLG
jgi:anaerobic selenocysteine-containing dehydrogenase